MRQEPWEGDNLPLNIFLLTIHLLVLATLNNNVKFTATGTFKFQLALKFFESPQKKKKKQYKTKYILFLPTHGMSVNNFV